jgi:H/ACA ribonucleoprotein complex subunit 3
LKALLFCRKCRKYTMGRLCPACGAATVSPHPAKYSPQDKYARFRRQQLSANQ